MSLKVSIEKNGPNVHLVMSGHLDEKCQLPTFAEAVRGVLTMDLEGLASLNSLGCRKWVLWIKEQARAKGGVRLVNCSPAAVGQLNVLTGFIPETVQVHSFFVPYTCDKCHHHERVLLTRGEEFGDGHVSATDEMPCHKCKGTMGLDVLPQQYFKFVSKSA